MACNPAGPPLNLLIRVLITLRSPISNPSSSISKKFKACSTISFVIFPSASTSAQSLTLFNSLLATLGVYRDLLAIVLIDS